VIPVVVATAVVVIVGACSECAQLAELVLFHKQPNEGEAAEKQEARAKRLNQARQRSSEAVAQALRMTGRSLIHGSITMQHNSCFDCLVVAGLGCFANTTGGLPWV
jgi:hypothetical protein